MSARVWGRNAKGVRTEQGKERSDGMGWICGVIDITKIMCEEME